MNLHFIFLVQLDATTNVLQWTVQGIPYVICNATLFEAYAEYFCDQLSQG